MNRDRFEAAVAAFDRANASDPNVEIADGQARPRELVQAERLSRWVDELNPHASEPLRLAARCQHIRRWEIPRSHYPEGRVGYLRWRKDLAKLHADTAGRILEKVGYDRDTIERVQAINTKKALKQDADAQAMEDALCLAFLEHEAEAFATKHAEEKVIDILQKTWRKMSDRGREVALKAELPDAVRKLVERALGASP